MHHSFLSCTEVGCPFVPTYLTQNVTQPPPRSFHAKLELYRKLFFWGPTVTRHIKKNYSTLNISKCCTSHCNESLDDNKFDCSTSRSYYFDWVQSGSKYYGVAAGADKGCNHLGALAHSQGCLHRMCPHTDQKAKQGSRTLEDGDFWTKIVEEKNFTKFPMKTMPLPHVDHRHWSQWETR